MADLGSGLRAPDQFSPVIKQAMDEQQRLGRQLEETYAGEERRLTERRSQTAPVYEAIRKELAQPTPQVPQTQDVPQFQPKEISSSDMQGFAMIAMAFAALGTKAMRGDITMAMNAASGAIKGFNEGALEQSALEMRQFEEKVKSVVSQNRQLMEKYNAVMESRKYSLQQKMQLLTVLGHENQDEAMIAAMKTGRLEHAMQRNQQLLTHSENLQMRADQMTQNFRQHMESMANARAIASMRLQAQQDRVQSKPIFVKLPDGSMTQIIPQFNEAGQLANLPPGAKVVGTSAGSQTWGGAQNARYAFNITESYAQAAQDLLNVSKMPAGTTLGAFAGMTGQSGDTLKTSLTTTLARKMTAADVRMMQQVVSGLEMNMGRALGGGYAQSSAQHMIEAYKQQIPKVGDSAITSAMFLARIKQELDILNNKFHGHPGATPEWVNQMNKDAENINKAIPFTVADVIAASSRGRISLSDKWRKLATEPVKQTVPTDVMKFSSEEEAAAANLRPGTRIEINGVQGTWQ